MRFTLQKMQAALEFVLDYFRLERDVFVQRYFSARKDILDMATTEAAHRRILLDLQNPEQQAIVAAPVNGNHLVLAGPGSGKTRVIVHRVAWLLREKMVLPEEILVLTYNRSAALEIRRRLWALVGADAAGVTVQTLHGLALRLTGTSYAVSVERGEPIDFADAIVAATTLLRQAEQDGHGSDGSASVQRDRLLAGLRYLLVDEYQDISGEHYDLISAIAGRTLQTEEERLSILVVGVDDQNIYAFGGADVRYIQQFESDYHARRYHLIENYRSSAHIIQCANQVIAQGQGRMKHGQEIRINHARKTQAPGGPYSSLDSLGQGQVHILEVPPNSHQEVSQVLKEIERIRQLSVQHHGHGPGWGRCAVIARRWENLEPLAALCRLHAIPVQLLSDDYQPHLYETRVGRHLLRLLQGERRRAAKGRVILRAQTLSRWLRRRHQLSPQNCITHPDLSALAQFIWEQENSAPNSERVISNLLEDLYEFKLGALQQQQDGSHSPLLLLSAHKAKGLEFDHVFVLDGGAWKVESKKTLDEERRLFYVAMTRARYTLTLVQRLGSGHAFLPACASLCRRSRSTPMETDARLAQRRWSADPRHIFLSWGARFAAHHPVHRALAALDHGSPLQLRPRPQGGWELATPEGQTVGAMSQYFQPPAGRIISVRVAHILNRRAGPQDRNPQVERWELVLPDIDYLPETP